MFGFSTGNQRWANPLLNHVQNSFARVQAEAEVAEILVPPRLGTRSQPGLCRAASSMRGPKKGVGLGEWVGLAPCAMKGGANPRNTRGGVLSWFPKGLRGLLGSSNFAAFACLGDMNDFKSRRVYGFCCDSLTWMFLGVTCLLVWAMGD